MIVDVLGELGEISLVVANAMDVRARYMCVVCE